MVQVACTKKCYTAMEAAEEAAERRSLTTGEQIKAYKCPRCG